MGVPLAAAPIIGLLPCWGAELNCAIALQAAFAQSEVATSAGNAGANPFANCFACSITKL
jgi:hypothetical protein